MYSQLHSDSLQDRQKEILTTAQLVFVLRYTMLLHLKAMMILQSRYRSNQSMEMSYFKTMESHVKLKLQINLHLQISTQHREETVSYVSLMESVLLVQLKAAVQTNLLSSVNEQLE